MCFIFLRIVQCIGRNATHTHRLSHVFTVLKERKKRCKIAKEGNERCKIAKEGNERDKERREEGDTRKKFFLCFFDRAS